MEKCIIGRWYDFDNGEQKTYFKPTEMYAYPDYVTIAGVIVEHNDMQTTFGSTCFSFMFTDFDSTFTL